MASRWTQSAFSLLLIASIVPLAVATGYQISASDTTSIPERTIGFQGDTYTLESTVQASPGETISVDANAPDETYHVRIYDGDRQIVAEKSATGDSSFSFDLSNYETGSYVIATSHDGNYTAVQPLLVSGYDVTIAAPSAASAGESFDVSLTVTPTAGDETPETVKVIVARDGPTHAVEATKTNGTYTATVDDHRLSEGSYTVYGVAQRDERAFGREEIVGLSDGTRLEMSAGSNATGAGAERDSSEIASPTSTSNGVITPNGTAQTSESTEATGPGFTFGAAAGAVIVGTTIVLRRRH